MNYLEGVDEEMYLYNGGKSTLSGYGIKSSDSPDERKKKMPETHMLFYRSLLPCYKTKDYIFVHAGLIPEVPLKKQTTHDLLWRFRVALRNSHITVFNQDRDLRYTWVYNPQPKSPAEDVLGRTDADLWPPEEAASLIEIKRRVMQGGRGELQEVRLTTGGETYFYDLTVEPLRDAAGAVVGVTCAASDVTYRKRMEESLHAMTMVDDLTGVYNRRGFMTLAEQQLKLARRAKSPSSCSTLTWTTSSA